MSQEYLTYLHSPLGQLTLSSDGTALTGLWFQDQAHYAATLSEGPVRQDDLPVFQLTRQWLDDYLDGRMPDPARLPLAPAGTPVRRRIWQRLLEIPYGETVTYGQIARELGSAMSAQAIGGAVGHNPMSIIIPCHRVMGANRSLTGYAGGLSAKKWLLEHEQSHSE